ncbi:MAG: amidase [Planctomycetota bacterium]|jgi:Asp-tRNA(Asn)/Glu-tRNA(Gln) amidotransferase A subunit family amidase
MRQPKLTLLALALAPLLADHARGSAPQDDASPVDAPALSAAGALIGLEWTEEEVEQMLGTIRERLGSYEELRGRSLANRVFPAPLGTPFVPGVEPAAAQGGAAPLVQGAVTRPDDLEEVCFWSIPELAALLRQGDVTSVELTTMYLDRLRRLDEHLHCVISLLPERALAQAAARDAELARGVDRGILHGLPWGVKDLMAVEGTRTTWGAEPYRDQVLEGTGTVVRRLDDAGAVLIAKLTLGALAMGDVWYGERTRSPWNLERGSSGSSAGSASATAAGGVAFSIGTETLGSIVSPSVACATSSLRPTVGRVPRTGAMALSWTMDKVGPITRTVRDADLVFRAIAGRDPADPYSRDGRVPVNGAVEGALRIGVPEGAFDRAAGLKEVLGELEAAGHELVPVTLPDYPVRAMLVILHAESAAAFDELTRSGRDDLLRRQGPNAWPNSFRAARMIPAVAYVQAQRLRSLLMADMARAMADVDLLVHAPYASGVLTITNLTGHPTVSAPFVPAAGPRKDGSPRTVCFTGHPDQDEALLAAVTAWQRAHPEHVLHPATPWLDADAAEGGEDRESSDSGDAGR